MPLANFGSILPSRISVIITASIFLMAVASSGGANFFSWVTSYVALRLPPTRPQAAAPPGKCMVQNLLPVTRGEGHGLPAFVVAVHNFNVHSPLSARRRRLNARVLHSALAARRAALRLCAL